MYQLYRPYAVCVCVLYLPIEEGGWWWRCWDWWWWWAMVRWVHVIRARLPCIFCNVQCLYKKYFRQSSFRDGFRAFGAWQQSWPLKCHPNSKYLCKRMFAATSHRASAVVFRFSYIAFAFAMPVSCGLMHFCNKKCFTMLATVDTNSVR